MRKSEFLAALRKGLNGLPQADIDASIEFYSEMIDDRMEDGLTEAEATEMIGPVGQVVSHILMETPLPKLVKAKVSPNRALAAWEIILLILGAPLWLPLLISVVIMALTLYFLIWVIVVLLYLIEVLLAGCALLGISSFPAYLLTGNWPKAGVAIGMGLICAGLAILWFSGSSRAAEGMLTLSKRMIRRIKSCFI